MERAGLTVSLRPTSVQRWPEAALAILACVIFLGSLGSPELWGKREQRAAAEALDTIENGHWLVAWIQGRPRLEKPPLPRWCVAVLLGATGCRSEWVVRLPSALAALATTVLTYALGRQMGGRRLALASAMVLCTTGLFVSELRQAGNDGLLGFFTTLALYTAWRRLHGGPRRDGLASNDSEDATSGPRHWCLLFYAAMGLGLLCKGPIVLLLVGMTVLPYLMTIGRLATGVRRLADGPGLLLFTSLALCWPVPVLISDPHALGVWSTEIGQKTGLLQIAHRDRSVLGLAMPLLALPWPVLAMAGAALPLVRGRRVRLPWRPEAIWFPWWWSIGNLAILSVWAVAKPNYFVPCLPGLALLSAMAWIRLARVARAPGRPAAALVASFLIRLQWLILLVAGLAAPAAGRILFPTANPAWLALIATMMIGGVGLGWLALRRRQDAIALVPVTAACAFGVLLGYGAIAPAGNTTRGHRQLAQRIQAIVREDVQTLRFFHEIDEGLWFYLDGLRLAPVPGSQPRYSESYAKIEQLLEAEGSSSDLAGVSSALRERERRRLVNWLARRGREEPYLLIRESLYRRMVPAVVGRATPVRLGGDLDHAGLVLLRAEAEEVRTAGPAPVGSTLR